jgi:hypothetical protein
VGAASVVRIRTVVVADAGGPRAVLDLLESAVNDSGRFERGLERLLDGIALGLERDGA